MSTIKLNVGGTIFETTLDTLMKCCYFQGVQRMNELTTQHEPYFIDRDPDFFKHILRLLRDPNYDYPEKYLNELDYYGIQYKEKQKENNTEPEDVKLSVVPILVTRSTIRTPFKCRYIMDIEICHTVIGCNIFFVVKYYKSYKTSTEKFSQKYKLLLETPHIYINNEKKDIYRSFVNNDFIDGLNTRTNNIFELKCIFSSDLVKEIKFHTVSFLA